MKQTCSGVYTKRVANAHTTDFSMLLSSGYGVNPGTGKHVPGSPSLCNSHSACSKVHSCQVETYCHTMTL